MTPADNKLLADLSRYWAWDGDLMRCKHCGRGLIASRDGEPLAHESTCPNATLQHPWAGLRALIGEFGDKDASA